MRKTIRLPASAVGATILAAGLFCAAGAAQAACQGALCYTQPGGSKSAVGGSLFTQNGKAIGAAQIQPSTKVGYGHGGIVSAGAGNGKSAPPANTFRPR